MPVLKNKKVLAAKKPTLTQKPKVLAAKKDGAPATSAEPKKKRAAKGEAKARTHVVEVLSAAQEKIIANLDKNVASIADMEEENQAFLGDLLESLDGKTTFVHPKLGAMTVMTRVTEKGGEHLFWRGKPVGRAGNSTKKDTKKAA